MRRNRGFTIIELLVVIGIIAVLLGILIPVVTGARNSAKRTQCAANLRTIFQAMSSYAADNDRKLPVFGNDSDYLWNIPLKTRDALQGLPDPHQQARQERAVERVAGAGRVDGVDAMARHAEPLLGRRHQAAVGRHFQRNQGRTQVEGSSNVTRHSMMPGDTRVNDGNPRVRTRLAANPAPSPLSVV